MEQKIEQLLIKGLNILIEMKERFLKEWKNSSSHLNPALVSEFDSLIQMALQHVSKQKSPSIDSLILSLLNEWQNRFSSLHDEFESIFLITSIEDLFHKLLAENPAATILEHQAVQSFFSRILDHSLLTHDSIDQTEKWLNMILTTNVLPMKWIAVVKKEQCDFTIGHVVCSSDYQIENHLLEICATLKASEITHLSNAISRLLVSHSVEMAVIQVPCINETLLIGVQGQTLKGTEQQIDFIRGLYLRQLKLHHLENKLEWKDASLLFLQSLLSAQGVDGAVQAITKGLVDYMPFHRCTLFLYNHNEDKGIGVSGNNVDYSSVKQIQEVIFKLPIMTKYSHSLKQSQPLYFSNAKDVLPEKYVQELRLKSLVILPILVPTESKLLGIALLDQGEESQFDVSTQTMATLIKFGHYAGEVLYSIWDEALNQFGSSNCVLTFREKEVLKLIAEGASINEAAQTLHLSSYTVRDYVSAIIQKLAAKNRTDAAVKAIKMKLIS